MTYYMKYDKYVINYANKIIEAEGGLQAAAASLSIDKGYLSKIANGKLIPSMKTFNRLFNADIKTETITYVVEEI